MSEGEYESRLMDQKYLDYEDIPRDKKLIQKGNAFDEQTEERVKVWEEDPMNHYVKKEENMFSAAKYPSYEPYIKVMDAEIGEAYIKNPNYKGEPI